MSNNQKLTIMDGWNLGDQMSLDSVFEQLEGMMYEVRFCVRGCCTGCDTYPELANYMRRLADSLKQAADDVECQLEEEYDDEL